MQLTKSQQLMVDIKDKNILVSAAAGSGKTATMVETVISKITDKDNPINIDDILMVTFSNLAANQMKEKIRKHLEKMIDKEPENEHIAKQLILVNRADICTIDKFCKKIVSDNYDKAGIDSNFDIAEPGMVGVISNEVFDKMFSKRYANMEANESFARLLNFFCKDGRDDSELRNYITELYYMSVKQTDPEGWLKQAIKSYNVSTLDELEKSNWVQMYIRHQKLLLEGIIDRIEATRSICEEVGGPEAYLNVIDEDINKINSILGAATYREMYDFGKNNWTRLPVVKKYGYDEELVSLFKTARDDYKKVFNSVFGITVSPENVLLEYESFRPYYIPFIELTLEFMKEFDDLKKKRKIFQFHDISHMAYRLMCVTDDDGNVTSSELAKKVAKDYKYIFIDEYQDGDYIQEGILTAVSACSEGIYNMSMVGDVKQSIYGFRNARPEIFIDKYNRYKDCRVLSDLTEDDKEARVLLNENFRSRKEVLDATNFFFYQLMDASIGGIDYGEDTCLKEGAAHPKCPSDVKTEILVANAFEGEEKSKYSKYDLEVALIVSKIKELLSDTNPTYVLRDDYKDILEANPELTEEEQKKVLYRRACPGDIAILLRSVKTLGEKLSNALEAVGIPASLERTKGYYEAVELRIVMSYMRILDNRYQDIPLSAVLLSPIAGLNDNEIAMVARYGHTAEDDKNITLWDKCERFIQLFDKVEDCYEIKKDTKIKRLNRIKKEILLSACKKLDNFFSLYEELKEECRDHSVGDIIWKLIDESGYYQYALAMPDGERRGANLDKLIEIANTYENGSYKGVFSFLQYIERIKLDSIDVGEASVGDKNNAVSILTMHKSKGLEYPIVFVSQLCKSLNGNDNKNILRFNNYNYISSKAIYEPARCRYNSVFDNAVNELQELMETAEEMRILYVAMTRAKEKLFLTGCKTKDYNNDTEKYADSLGENVRLPYIVRACQMGYMFWIENCYKKKNLFPDADNYLVRQEVSYKELEAYIEKSTVKKAVSYETIISNARALESKDITRLVEKEMNYAYEYDAYTKIKSKYSITEIKKMKAYGEDEEDIPVKKIINPKKSSISASERGSLVHKFMELYPFEQLDEMATLDYYNLNVTEYLDRLIYEEIFTKEEASVIPVKNIALFFTNNLGQRMIKAAKRRELFKEKGFTISFPADEVFGDIPELVMKKTDDVILVQGIIDAFFYEDGKIILMDYKTDSQSFEKLYNLYHAQLKYYGKTLENLVGMVVAEKLIYSFHNDGTVSVE